MSAEAKGEAQFVSATPKGEGAEREARYVLLDFDGVIANAKTYAGWRNQQGKGDGVLLDPECIAQVQRVCDAVGAVVVLSTSWRCAYPLDTLRGWLAERGLTVPVVGATPWERDAGQWRHEEILAWMHREQVQCWQIAILDDDPIPPPLADRWIPSSFSRGFTDAHAARAIALFAPNPPNPAPETSS